MSVSRVARIWRREGLKAQASNRNDGGCGWPMAPAFGSAGTASVQPRHLRERLNSQSLVA